MTFFKINAIIKSIPYCDECNIQLRYTNMQLTSYPSYEIYQCPQCKQEYKFNQSELEDTYNLEYIGDED